ncbi:hypothetical protein BDN70DRAFT_897639 [Pholiota conissans]|uniref:F-box domain-containing protein n=1 Tax=Pholiota conissans TaxID=109636 RepID=A0A9P6CRD7_9AGAR|nr:hypothetical protein BDN70DRAFT_897639 [Pholiota conissans]
MPVRAISLPTSFASFGHDNTGNSSVRPLKIPRIKRAATALLRHGYRTPSNHAAELRHQNSLNSACVLPDLVIRKIFLQCAELSVTSQSDEGDAWSWVSISHVCSSWRRVALQSPDLWRYVDFSHPKWYMLTWARAKMSALHVIATVTATNIRQLRCTLQLAHRIQDIHLISPIEKVHPLLESLTHPNPSVESLILDVRPSQIPDVIDIYAPPSFPTSYSGPPLTKLKYLELHHAPFYLLTSRCINLTHFHLYDLPLTERPTLHYFLQMLENLTHLRSLTLDRSFPINIEFNNITTGERRIELPQLENISLAGNMVEIGNILTCLAIPPSAHLIIRITTLMNLTSTISNFTQILASHSLAQVEYVPLDILVLTGHEFCERYIDIFSPNPEYRQSLRIRAFSAGSEEGGAVIDLTINPDEFDPNDDGMITALTAILTALPLAQVHTLALQDLEIVTQSSWTSFLQPLTSLRVLDIAGRAPSGLVWALLLNARSHGKRFKDRHDESQRILVPSLEDIYLHNVDCSSGGYMVAPNSLVNSHRDLDDSRFLDVLIASLTHRRRFALCLRSLCIAQCTFFLRKTVEDARKVVSYLICDFRNVMKEETYDETFPARYPPQWRTQHAQLRHYHRLRALTELDS